MTRLSNAGRLYLNEYYILTEARRDLETFLDLIVDEVARELMARAADLSNEKFILNVWQNKSTKGRIDIEFKTKEKVVFFREGKSDISVIYEDIRHTDKLQSSETIRLSVWTSSASKGIEQLIQQCGVETFNKNVHEEIFIPINLDDSTDAVEEIVEQVFEKSKMIFSVLCELARKD